MIYYIILYIYIHKYVYMSHAECMYVCLFVFSCINKHMCMYVYIHTHTVICIYIYIHIRSVYIHMGSMLSAYIKRVCVCMYIYIYVCVCIVSTKSFEVHEPWMTEDGL